MILYFSGTGNSKYVANKLSTLLSDRVISINDLIKNNDKSNIDVNGSLIIVTPTYAWRIPNIVREFIINANFTNVSKVYFVMTCGGEIGNANKYNNQLADLKKFTYMGTIGVLMPDNYIIMFKSPKDKTIKERLGKVDSKLSEISNFILNSLSFPKPRNNLYDRFMSKFVNKQFYKYYLGKEGFFTNDKCIKCLKCVKMCPLNNIKLVNDKITYGNNCTHCMACISYCPSNAINYQNKTINKKPYKIEDYITNNK